MRKKFCDLTQTARPPILQIDRTHQGRGITLACATPRGATSSIQVLRRQANLVCVEVFLEIPIAVPSVRTIAPTKYRMEKILVSGVGGAGFRIVKERDAEYRVRGVQPGYRERVALHAPDSDCVEKQDSGHQQCQDSHVWPSVARAKNHDAAGRIWSPATWCPEGSGFDKALTMSTSIANARSTAISVKNPPRLFRILVQNGLLNPARAA
jgi:hypothetical protein